MKIIIEGSQVDIIQLPFNGRAIRYISSDIIPSDAVIKFFERVTGKPGMKWIVTPHEQFRKRLLITGLNFTRTEHDANQ